MSSVTNTRLQNKEQHGSYGSSKNNPPCDTACGEGQGVGCYNASEEDRCDVEEDIDSKNLFETIFN